MLINTELREEISAIRKKVENLRGYL